jgi:hypothetical protein
MSEPSNEPSNTAPPLAPSPYQFSLRQLMIGVTVVAVFCSLVVSSGLRPKFLMLATHSRI